MQTIVSYWNEALAFFSTVWTNTTSIPIEKQVAVLFLVIIIGFIQDRALKALLKSGFMQYKVK